MCLGLLEVALRGMIGGGGGGKKIPQGRGLLKGGGKYVSAKRGT